jgi:hypothetical protein
MPSWLSSHCRGIETGFAMGSFSTDSLMKSTKPSPQSEVKLLFTLPKYFEHNGCHS